MGSAPLTRILLIEDEEDIRTVACMALRMVGGFEVHLCCSGAQAVSDAQAFGPDLILLDVMMPGMSGPETLRALRGVQSMLEVPVVFMTAGVQAEQVSRLMSLGALGVVPKPFDPMTLSATLQDLWSARHA